jgi:hypothetical protein
MKRVLSLCLAMQLFATCAFSQQNQIDSIIKDFKSFMFEYKIQPARRALERYEQVAIPKIIPLLYSTAFTKIEDEPYLMYPASKDYMFSHGYMIAYNLDWLSIRAGWLIEELTFMDFGYKTALDEKKYAVITDYDYRGKREIPWINAPTKASLLKTRKPMAEAVAAWWQKNKATFTRIGALKEALQSNNTTRQIIALDYLMDGLIGDDWDQLTNKYKQEIEPLILALKKSNNKSIADNAKRLAELWGYKDEQVK